MIGIFIEKKSPGAWGGGEGGRGGRFLICAFPSCREGFAPDQHPPGLPP